MAPCFRANGNTGMRQQEFLRRWQGVPAIQRPTAVANVDWDVFASLVRSKTKEEVIAVLGQPDRVETFDPRSEVMILDGPSDMPWGGNAKASTKFYYVVGQANDFGPEGMWVTFTPDGVANAMGGYRSTLMNADSAQPSVAPLPRDPRTGHSDGER